MVIPLLLPPSDAAVMISSAEPAGCVNANLTAYLDYVAQLTAAQSSLDWLFWLRDSCSYPSLASLKL